MTEQMSLDAILEPKDDAELGNNARIPAGLLTQRLLRDQTFHYVHKYPFDGLPNRNIWVLVSAFAVQVKEVIDGGHFRTLIVKEDFDTKICAAYLLTERPNTEADDAGWTTGQALALTLQTQQLLFLSLSYDRLGEHRFTWTEEPLPAFPSVLHDPGRYLSADPYARVLAVGAFENNILFRAFGSESANAVPKAVLFNCGMVISAIEFLFQPDGNKDSTTLAVVGSKGGRQQTMIYQWGNSHELDADKVQIYSSRLVEGIATQDI